MYITNHIISALRRGLCVLLSALILGAMLLPGLGVDVQAAEKTVTIPSPADYFGDVDDTDSGKSNTAYYFEGYSTFPKSKVEQYINALKKAGLTTKDKSDSSIIDLKYNGERKVQISWDKSNQWIRVNVVKPLSVSASTTNTKDEETDVIKTDSKGIAVPHPADYFGTVADTSNGNTSKGFFFEDYSSFPKAKVESYIKALKKLGLTDGTIKDDDGDKVAVMKWAGKEEMWIRWDKGKKRMFINISEPLTVAKATGTTISDDVTPIEPKSDDPSIIDFLESCFGTPYKTSYDEENYITYLYFKSSSTFPQSKFDKLKNTAEEYNLEFNSAGFRNSTRVSIDSGDGGSLIWGYWFKNQSEIRMDIKWEYVKKSGKFDTSDIPDEPVPPQPTNGTVECGTCRGRRYCQDCNGKGEEKKRVIGQPGVYTTKTCGTCHGLKKCPTCEGHGWVSG